MNKKINKIAVIGATGLVGHAVVGQAIKKGYQVVAVVRNPSKIAKMENLTIEKGDVFEFDTLATACKDVDAVISCIGPDNDFKPGTLMSQGTQNIVEACKADNIRKLIMMSGILQSDGKELSFANRTVLKIIRTFYRNVYHDKIIAESTVKNSALDWVIVRAAGLNKSEGDGHYHAGIATRISPFRPLPYTDCAACLLQATEETEWNQKIINVGNR